MLGSKQKSWMVASVVLCGLVGGREALGQVTLDFDTQPLATYPCCMYAFTDAGVRAATRPAGFLPGGWVEVRDSAVLPPLPGFGGYEVRCRNMAVRFNMADVAAALGSSAYRIDLDYGRDAPPVFLRLNGVWVRRPGFLSLSGSALGGIQITATLTTLTLDGSATGTPINQFVIGGGDLRLDNVTFSP